MAVLEGLPSLSWRGIIEGMKTKQRLSFRVRVDQQGRLVIPAEAREALRIEPGEPMSLVVDGSEIRLLTIRQAIENAQAIARKHTKGRTGLVDEFLRERRADSGE